MLKKTKKNIFLIMVFTVLLFSIFTGCQEGIDDSSNGSEDNDSMQDELEIVATTEFEKVFFLEWFDEDTIIAIKENEELEKLNLEELSDKHPQSVYKFHTSEENYELILERENANIYEASLSLDSNYMIYSIGTLGDPAFHIYNIQSSDDFLISGDPIGGAISAKWTDEGDVIGSAYSGGVYISDKMGNISLIDNIPREMTFLVEKIDDMIFFNTQNNLKLSVYNTKSQELSDLDFEDVIEIYKSPKDNQLLIVESNEDFMTLYKFNPQNNSTQEIQSGNHIGGVSWSPNKKLVSYIVYSNSDDSNSGKLYIKNLDTNQELEVASNIQYGTTSWSPAGDKLVFTTWDDEYRTSNIVELKN